MNKKFMVTLLSIVMVFVLVACAGSNGGNGSGNDTTDTTAEDENGNGDNHGNGDDAGTGGFVQGVTDDTILIGNSIATSGALAPVGVPFKAGMDAYIMMINENGGINGRMIEYIHQDDEFNPERGLAILDGLINDEEVFAIVGSFGTPVIGATFRELVDSGIPAVYFAAGTGVVYNENATDGDGRNTFPVQPVFPMEGRVFAAWAAGTFDAERIGVIFTNDDAGQDLVGGVRQEAETIGGLEVIAEQVAPGADDVTAAVASILAADVDVIVIASIQGTFPQIARELAAQGNTLPALTTYVNVDRTMVDLIADDMAGDSFDIFGSSWVDMTVPEIALYQEWIAQVSNEDFSTNAFAITGWIAMHTFAQGLERVDDGELTWESFIVAMEVAPVENPFGSAIDFSNGSRVGTQDLALAQMSIDEATGWVPYLPFMSMAEILGN